MAAEVDFHGYAWSEENKFSSANPPHCLNGQWKTATGNPSRHAGRSWDDLTLNEKKTVIRNSNSLARKQLNDELARKEKIKMKVRKSRAKAKKAAATNAPATVTADYIKKIADVIADNDKKIADVIVQLSATAIRKF